MPHHGIEISISAHIFIISMRETLYTWFSVFNEWCQSVSYASS